MLQGKPRRQTRVVLAAHAAARPATTAGTVHARQSTAGTRHRVLIVEDEPDVCRIFARALSSEDCEVVCANDGGQAKGLLSSQSFDVIVSDIGMPRVDGIELLQTVHEHDADVPVILVTGEADVQTAMRAVEYGALRYLEKPVSPSLLRKIVGRAVQLHELARIKRRALRLLDHRADLASSFTSALTTVWMAFQPVVRASMHSVHGYEALVRVQHARFPHATALIRAAERLGLMPQLGRTIRARAADAMPRLPGAQLMFVNVHPLELGDEQLYSSDAPLSRHAERVVLEITERARLNRIRDLDSRVARLRSLGYRLAVDDLGSGYAGLTSFVHLNPEFVKIDMTLARGVHRDPTRQSLVRSLLAVCAEMGIHTVVEGVESPEEQATLTTLGADLLQGYLFAPPAKNFLDDEASCVTGNTAKCSVGRAK